MLITTSPAKIFTFLLLACLCLVVCGADGGRAGRTAPLQDTSDSSVTEPEGGTAKSTAEATPLRPVEWRRLSFEARKLLLKATTTLTVESRPSAQARLELRPAPSGGQVELQTSEATLLRVETDLPFGRDELVSSWLDTRHGAVLQSEKLVSGSKSYWKLRRYTAEGLFQWRAEPEGRSESRLAKEQWSRRSQYLIPWDQGPDGLAVTDSYALLYLMSAARLDREGARLDVGIFSKKRLVSLELEAGTLQRASIDLVRQWPGGSDRVRETVSVREVRCSGRLLSGAATDDDVELGFLGMQGEIRALLLEGSGIPVEVRGTTDSFGSLTVRLRSAILLQAPD